MNHSDHNGLSVKGTPLRERENLINTCHEVVENPDIDQRQGIWLVSFQSVRPAISVVDFKQETRGFYVRVNTLTALVVAVDRLSQHLSITSVPVTSEQHRTSSTQAILPEKLCCLYP